MTNFPNLRAAIRIATHNALGPGLGIATVLGVPVIVVVSFAPFWIAVWLLILLTLITVSVVGAFLLHTVRNPKLLQSEDYQLKQEAITLFGDKSLAGKDIARIVSSGQSIRNPVTIEHKAKNDE